MSSPRKSTASNKTAEPVPQEQPEVQPTPTAAEQPAPSEAAQSKVEPPIKYFVSRRVWPD